LTARSEEFNPLAAPLQALVAALESVRDDQASIGMTLGRSPIERDDRRRFLASEVLANAEKIDDALAEAIQALNGTAPAAVLVSRLQLVDLLVQVRRASHAFNAAGLAVPGGLALAAERVRNSIGINAAQLPES